MPPTTSKRPPARRPAPPRRGAPAPAGGRLWRWRRPLFCLGLACAAAVSGGLWYLAHVPLPKPHAEDLTTDVYAADGQLLTTYQVQNRADVRLAQVPPVLIDAVVSTEDRHFFGEGAINVTSMARALLSDLFGHGSLQGGSTITQQYVKQAYLTPQRTLTRKLKEAFIAIRLSQVDSKDAILQDYLNTIYFGRGAYGIEAAAQTYFGVDVGRLDLPESALLAGLIREPDTADPAVDAALARTNQVDTLDAMVRDHHITPAQAAAAAAIPFSRYVRPDVTAGTRGGAPGVAGVAGDQYYLAAVHAQLVATYGAAAVDSGGLRVTTTLNPTLQADAYNSVYGSGPDALDPAKGDPSGAMVTMDTHGDVEALVGGQNYAASQVDLALGQQGGGSGRPAGSTFKAFMLAEVIKQGYSVESTFAAPGSLVVPHGNANGTDWDVSNFEQEASAKKLSLIAATAQSINTVYAQVVERLGPQSLDTMAEALGIPASALPEPYPSQVLGAAEVSPLEMAAAYDTFADGGVYNSPVFITKVTTSTGAVLPLPAHQRRVVLTPDQVSVVDYVLQQVVLDGTGGAAGDVGAPVAGKTGTTDDSADAWFVGYTPRLTTAMWMGYPRGEIPMLDFRGFKSIQGGTVPAEIWHDAVAAYLAADPAYGGVFPPVASLGGAELTAPTNVIFPTTTTTSTVPRTTTTVRSSTTTRPRSSTTTTPTSSTTGTTVVPTTTTSSSPTATTTTVATPSSTVAATAASG